jgi:predicted DNA-binding transcriptional regulator AlpA
MAMRVLSVDEAAERFGVGRTVYYDGVKTGRFPKPIQVSPGRVGVVEMEIDACIERLMKERDERLVSAA